MSRFGGVYTNLVFAPGLKSELDECSPAASLDDGEVGTCKACTYGRLFCAMDFIAFVFPEVALPCPAVGSDDPFDYTDVDALDFVSSEAVLKDIA